MPSAVEITKHHDPIPGENPWVKGPPPPEKIEVVAYDEGWPALYGHLADGIRQALGDRALALDHVGSTSVPGLAAKPVIDIDLTVADPSDETAYVPALEEIGYDLVIREPSWHQHRCFRLHAPRANLHVFGPDCPETIRHRLFRDWLRDNPADRELYEQAKLRALQGVDRVMDYNLAKQPVIREIYARVFKAAGLI